MSPTYFPNGVNVMPGFSIDEAQSWAITQSTGGNLVVVANAASTTANAEAIQISTSGAITMPVAVTMSSAVTMSGSPTVTGTFKVASAGQGITGIFLTTLSTYAPGILGTSTGRVDTVASTSFTWTTSDIVLAQMDIHGTSTNPVAIASAFGSSSGAVGIMWVNPSSAGFTPSTGAYRILTFRTT